MEFDHLMLLRLACFLVFSIEVQTQPLNVTSILVPPYLMEKKDGTYEGYIVDLVDRLAQKVGFDYQISLVKDNKFGDFIDGSFTGMVGELVRGEADMAAAPLTVTDARSSVVDFTYPFQTVGPVIILRRPDDQRLPVKDRLIKLLIALEFSVWLMTVLAFFVTGTVLYLITYFNPYEWRKMYKDGEATVREAESFTCLNSFWFVISTCVWQGFTRTPRSIGGRIAVTGWWIFVIIFLTTYTASLTNLLRVGPKPYEVEGYSKIQNFKDLASQDDVTIGIIKGGATQDFFERSTGSVEKAVWNKIQINKAESLIDTPISNGIDRLRRKRISDFALILESSMAKYFTRHQPCDLYIVSEQMVTAGYSLAFPQGSPLFRNVSVAVLSMMRDGILKQLEEKWFTGTCKNYIYESVREDRFIFPEFYQVDLGTFSGALFILAVGLVFGGIVTLTEICIFRWAESHGEEGKSEIAKGGAKESVVDSKRQNAGDDTGANQKLLGPEVRVIPPQHVGATTV
ncbi:hypothetical protein ACJMK2_035743 [Sinanodonta woodiana]|uniref:Uncharacterized protein n=1 Tax=Sinanodonta woodiana TaxID=1069815 RepID=A0ABD3WEZ0_SINWO